MKKRNIIIISLFIIGSIVVLIQYKIPQPHYWGSLENDSLGSSNNEDQKMITLKALVKKYPDGVISECNYKSTTYFSVYPHYRLADAATLIYNMNGNEIASGGGYVATNSPVDPLYKNIRPSCTLLIYNPGMYDSSTGQTTKVDVYNLSNY